ncbi:hypothetical protein [Lacticaseibacillus hulanensis]|uniref:hypothetical protein n=1 Tax=Lacticaseibacillus hulanensis TaxID=2493111 RepID=UPI000FD716DA|nr:hypothetical protein [Lacticaseibacillus hulanensis]
MTLKDEFASDVEHILALRDEMSYAALTTSIELVAKYARQHQDCPPTDIAMDQTSTGAAATAKTTPAAADAPDKPATAEPAETGSTTQTAETPAGANADANPDADHHYSDAQRKDVKPSVAPRAFHRELPTVRPGAAAARAAGIYASDAQPYRIERKLSGAQAGPFYIKESLARSMNLRNGNTVIIPRGNFNKMRLIDQTHVPAGIERIERVLLSADAALPAPYVAHVTCDYLGAPIHTEEGELVDITFTQSDLDYVRAKVGDVCDIAWYKNSGMQSAHITWVHRNLVPIEQKAAPAPAAEHKKTTPVDPDKPKTATNLDFDLDGKRVLIIGFEQSLKDLRPIVLAHNGLCTISEEMKSHKLRNKVMGADIVVPVISQAHHHNTNGAIGLAKIHKKKYAVATGSSPLALERAIYRAITDGLPAFESSGEEISYPLSAS